MSPDMIDRAAHALLDARRTRRLLTRLPEACRPRDEAEGFAIQRRVVALLDDAIGGWKCSVPNASRTIPAAPIGASRLARQPPPGTPGTPCGAAAFGRVARIEPEIAFVLGHDLPARGEPWSEDEVRQAIGSTHVVIELIDSAFADAAAITVAENLADRIAHDGLYVGPEAKGGFAQPLAQIPLAIESAGRTLLEREGRHGDGDPLRPLYWLAGFAAANGLALKRGDVITTGSYAGILEVPLDTPLAIHFGTLGTLEVELRAAQVA